MKKILSEKVRAALNLPHFLDSFLKVGVRTGISKFVDYVAHYKEFPETYSVAEFESWKKEKESLFARMPPKYDE